MKAASPKTRAQGRTAPAKNGLRFRRARRRFDRDVEMQHRLPNPKLFVERDGRIVAVVRLNGDDPGAALGGNLAQTRDQGCRDALLPMLRADGQVIDVHLAPRLLE